MRRIAVLAATAAFAFAGCGGDDEPESAAHLHRGTDGSPDRSAHRSTDGGGRRRHAGDRRRPGRRAEVHRDRVHGDRRPGHGRVRQRLAGPARRRDRGQRRRGGDRDRDRPGRPAARGRPARRRVHDLLPGRQSPPGRGWKPSSRSGSRRSARGRAPRTTGARSRRAGRAAARSGRCRASACGRGRRARTRACDATARTGPWSWASTKRTPGSHSSIRVSQRIGSRCRVRRYSISVPARISIGRGVTTWNASHGGVIASRLPASAKNGKTSSGVPSRRCSRVSV